MPTGLTRDAGWQIGVSRTLGHPVEVVWEHLLAREGLHLWLGGIDHLPDEPGTGFRTAEGGTGELRSRRSRDRVRLRWQPPGRTSPTTLQVAVQARGDRTMVRFHQERLADAEERERQRGHWRGVLDQLEALLEQ